MIQKNLLVLAFGLVLSIWASNSFAVGLGLAYGQASETWEDNDTSFHDGDREVKNIGIVFDTTVAKNRLFNYRLTIMQEENNIDSGGRVDMDGYAMTHDFGFAVFRNKVTRIWLGPQLKGSYYADVTGPSGVNSGDVIGFGLSPVIGVNLHLPKVVSFGLVAGYQLLGAYGGEYGAFDTELDVRSSGTFFNLSVIFRIDDEFK